MRLNSTNNKFIFNFPVDFIAPHIYENLSTLMEKNFIPYETVLEYLNSTIKEVVFPSVSFDNVEQTIKRGKVVAYKPATNVMDAFSNEIDLTMGSVDSGMNYFIMIQVLIEFFLNNSKPTVSDFSIDILDIHGDKIYTVLFKDVLLKNIGENRMGYQMFDMSEKTFTITFRYNFIDILYTFDKEQEKSILDVPINFTPGPLDNLDY